ncbi:MAG: tetratricopeptide repeat protein [Betaproteobacteria bacterium]
MVLLLCTLLAACASTPVTYRTDDLFSDALFQAASERVSGDDVFALSDEMRRYLYTEIASRIREKGSERGLFDALYNARDLKLDYDSVMTRNASEAFAAHSGNCLSLVIMTAAFAKELGLPFRFQSVLLDETWSRSGDVQFFIGHVNLTLGRKTVDVGYGRGKNDALTIDFLPPEEIRGLPKRVIDEKTIVAMYMNNRSAERYTQGQLDDAYWWARAAVAHDPRFVSAYNTLGVIYQRHGNLPEAERVLRYALEREPDNPKVMSNLISVLNNTGQSAEATVLTRRMERIDPDPAFSFFSRGVRSMREGDYAAARDLFAKEVDRAPYYHEFHFWLALAYVGLGDTAQARKHLNIAIESSTSRGERELYATKLDRISASRVQ